MVTWVASCMVIWGPLGSPVEGPGFSRIEHPLQSPDLPTGHIGLGQGRPQQGATDGWAYHPASTGVLY